MSVSGWLSWFVFVLSTVVVARAIDDIIWDVVQKNANDVSTYVALVVPDRCTVWYTFTCTRLTSLFDVTLRPKNEPYVESSQKGNLTFEQSN